MKTLILTLLLLTACGRHDELPVPTPPPVIENFPDERDYYNPPNRNFCLGSDCFLPD